MTFVSTDLRPVTMPGMAEVLMIDDLGVVRSPAFGDFTLVIDEGDEAGTVRASYRNGDAGRLEFYCGHWRASGVRWEPLGKFPDLAAAVNALSAAVIAAPELLA